MKLAGKTALITGGNSGIGLATAKLFKDEGARVAVTGRNPAGLDNAQRLLGDDALVLASDVSRVDQIEQLMTRIGEHFGKLDILVVNAAIAQPEPFESVAESTFDSTASINFKGAFFTIQKALPLLSGSASIIVTTSISNQMGSPNFSVYAACKAALRNLVQTLGLELIKRGARINAISPGPIDTPMWERFGLPPEITRSIRDGVIAKSPIGRYGEADEVAKAALFLASDDASYIVGQEIAVDGGMSLL
jgi:NAD(P)-dependent dehydrogenase (short-subunit alcohol dehydrogenase family)